MEKHLTVQEVADQWSLSEETVRRLFRDEPGVLLIGNGTRKAGRRYKRRYFLMRIP